MGFFYEPTERDIHAFAAHIKKTPESARSIQRSRCSRRPHLYSFGRARSHQLARPQGRHLGLAYGPHSTGRLLLDP